MNKWAGSRGTTFAIQMLYLGGLAALATLFFTKHIHPPNPIGSMPIAVPWFGALGAVLLSLSGIFDHYVDWLPSYRYWHWARPFVGAAVGIISVMIVQAGIVAVGSSATPDKPALATGNLTYYLIAFLVGYRENTFRELVKRLADVVLAPGDGASSSSLKLASMTPALGPTSGATDVVFTGTGLSTIQSVKFGETEATEFTAESDTRLTAKTPPAAQPGAVTVLLLGKDGSALVQQFTYEQPPPGPPAPAVPVPPAQAPAP